MLWSVFNTIGGLFINIAVVCFAVGALYLIGRVIDEEPQFVMLRVLGNSIGAYATLWFIGFITHDLFGWPNFANVIVDSTGLQYNNGVPSEGPSKVIVTMVWITVWAFWPARALFPICGAIISVVCSYLVWF